MLVKPLMCAGRVEYGPHPGRLSRELIDRVSGPPVPLTPRTDEASRIAASLDAASVERIIRAAARRVEQPHSSSSHSR